jgi:hypothetical protein
MFSAVAEPAHKVANPKHKLAASAFANLLETCVVFIQFFS